MKIYHISLLAPGQPNAQLAPGLANRGTCYELDWMRCMNRYGVKILRRKIIEDVERIRPDLVFMQIQTANIIDAATADAMRKWSFVVNWTGDVREDITWYEQLADHVNLTLFTNMTDVKLLRKKNKCADYLQIGFDENIYTPVGYLGVFPEIVFCGNNYMGLKGAPTFPLSRARIEMVDFMRREFPRQFQVYGNGWGKHDNRYLGTKYLQPEGEAQAYRTAKIAINQNHFDYERFSSDRIFRIMGCGCFCVTKHYPGIEKEFIDGVHVRTYETLKDLANICDYYLKHDADRKEIATNGMKLVRENCTWGNRAEQLFKMYEDHVWNFDNLELFKVYSQNYEDSYLQRILFNIGVKHGGFVVDLGAGDGHYISNSKYLREKFAFKSILIDGDNKGNSHVHEHWITRENVNTILSQYECPQNFDLLSIDLDGNDWHILKKILSRYEPKVIIAEINPIFERDEAFTIEYNEKHQWGESDFYGASLAAFEKLGKEFGYKLVLVTDSLNAFFVRADYVNGREFKIKYNKKNDFKKGAGQWVSV